MRSPENPSTSSAKVSRTAASNGTIDPETSRHSTMSRVPNRSAVMCRSAGRAASVAAPTTASTTAPTPAHRSTSYVRSA